MKETKLIITRPYRYDRAMQEAIRRIGKIPTPIVLTSNVKGNQNAK